MSNGPVIKSITLLKGDEALRRHCLTSGATVSGVLDGFHKFEIHHRFGYDAERSIDAATELFGISGHEHDRDAVLGKFPADLWPRSAVDKIDVD